MAPPVSPLLNDVPSNLLESFLPGYGILRRLIESTIGWDISTLVSAVFILLAVAKSAQYVWTQISRRAVKYVTSSVRISNSDSLYQKVMHWIARNGATKDARFLIAETESEGSRELRNLQWDMDSAENLEFSDMDARLTPLYTPSFGERHYFYHKGTWFVFYRSEERFLSPTAISNGTSERESLVISCFGLSPNPIKSLIQDCKKYYIDKKRSTTSIFHAGSWGRQQWQQMSWRPTRSLDTVYLDPQIKTDLLNDAKEFLRGTSARFYAQRGIPYRRGYLFHGPPGTGKTSLTLSLAGYFGLGLYVLNLVDINMSDERLGTLFGYLPPRCIVLLEDIDAAGLVPKTEEQAKEVETILTDNKALVLRGQQRRQQDRPGVTLSGLLNAIDGVASQEGRILVMTTNDPESLDEALIRPGRVDMQVYFGNLSQENAKVIFQRMYDKEDVKTPPQAGATLADNPTQNKKSKDQEHIETLASEFAGLIPEGKLTPAEVQGFLLKHRKSPEEALDGVCVWRDEVLAAKETKTNVILPISANEDNTVKENGIKIQVNGIPTEGGTQEDHHNQSSGGDKASSTQESTKAEKEVNGDMHKHHTGTNGSW